MDLFDKKRSESIESDNSLSTNSSSSTYTSESEVREPSNLKKIYENPTMESQPHGSTTEQNLLKKSDSNAYNREYLINAHRSDLEDFEINEIKRVSSVYYFAPTVEKLIPGTRMRRNDKFEDDLNYYLIIPNDHLCYRYEILEVLGCGSYGTVVKSFDHKERREVAIKIFRKGSIFNTTSQHEIKILQLLHATDEGDSANIVRYFDSFNFRDHTCITFEVLESDVAALMEINRHGLDRKIIRNIIRSVLNGLDFIHGRHLIHGDMKPGNIGIKSSGEFDCKILDFGLCLFEDDSADNSVIQAPLYRAPEVYLKAPFNNKVDIWGVGCVAAEMAKGTIVFHGKTDEEQMASYVDHLGFPPKELVERSANADSFFVIYPGGVAFKLLPGYNQCNPRSKSLQDSLGVHGDAYFIDFLKKCFEMNPDKRYSAKQLLAHSWMKETERRQIFPTRCTTQ